MHSNYIHGLTTGKISQELHFRFLNVMSDVVATSIKGGFSVYYKELLSDDVVELLIHNKFQVSKVHDSHFVCWNK